MGTPAIATSTSGVYQGGGGGGSGQVGTITIPVAEGMELTISLGAVSPPGNTVTVQGGLSGVHFWVQLLSNKVICFYSVFNGLALGERGQEKHRENS